jgi:hypothetical protein
MRAGMAMFIELLSLGLLLLTGLTTWLILALFRFVHPD